MVGAPSSTPHATLDSKGFGRKHAKTRSTTAEITAEPSRGGAAEATP
jgi:hypothetical protein